METGARETGFRSISPRIVVHDVETLVEFLRRVFNADATVVDGRPAQVHIGDSTIVVSSTADHETFPALLEIHVDDIDDIFGRAMVEGAEILEPPTDNSDRQRRTVFCDRFGNQYRVLAASDS